MLQRISARLVLFGLALSMVCGLPALPAQAHGDFAPRGSLLYVRAQDVSGALQGLLGRDWRTHAESIVALLGDDLDDRIGGLDEVRRFIDHLGETEVVIADVMVREPHVQLIEVTRLKEGAPQAFSEEFVKQVNQRGGRSMQAEKTRLRNGEMLVRLVNGMMITTIGGAAEAHVEDVLAGNTAESLSQVEKFRKWSEGASGHIVAWADMASWRTALERVLGESGDDEELRTILDFIEWHKWDTLTASATLPGETSGIQIRANLTTREPLSRAAVVLRPSGASRMAGLLPAETLAFTSIQLGTDHEKTYFDAFHAFHDLMQRTEPRRIERRIDHATMQRESDQARLAQLRQAEDNQANRDRIKRLEDQIKRSEAMIAQWKVQLAAYKERPFNPQNEAGSRTGRTEPEQVHDEINNILRQFNLTRSEIADALGAEAVAGIIDLPDAAPSRDDPEYWQDHWFAAVEVTHDFDAVKNKLLDGMLARNLPDDMPERDRARATRQAESLVRYDVPGGEILCERRIAPDFVAFAGSGIAGIAANDAVARRMLEAAQGAARFNTSRLGGGTTGSKLAWVDLRATIERLLQGSETRSRNRLSFPDLGFDLRRAFGGGAWLSVQTDERANGLSLRVTFTGTRDFSGVLPMFRDELASQLAAQHDKRELRVLSDALRAWKVQNAQALADATEDDRKALLKSATLEALMADGQYRPYDGLRSAFDPAHGTDLQGHEPFGDDANDLSQASFEYHGLFTGDWHASVTAEEELRELHLVFASEFQPIRGWVVASLRKPWARGGHFVLLERRDDLRVSWMAERDLRLLLTANAEGRVTVDSYERVEPNPPLWKRRKALGRAEWELRSLYDALEAKRQADESFAPTFQGGSPEELAAALGSERVQIQLLDLSQLRIWTDEQGIHVRLSNGDAWAQYGPKGVSASWMPDS